MLRNKLRAEACASAANTSLRSCAAWAWKHCIAGQILAGGVPSTGSTPDLLRGLNIERTKHVSGTNSSYIPMSHRFMYLFAVMDWATRRILAWRLSNTLTTDFCVGALARRSHETRYAVPEIFNTDRGSQFTDKDSQTIKLKGARRLNKHGWRWRNNFFYRAIPLKRSPKMTKCICAPMLKAPKPRTESAQRRYTTRLCRIHVLKAEPPDSVYFP